MVPLSRVSLCPEDFPDADVYPFRLPVLRATRTLAFTAPIPIFVGENGTGKSTLLEAIGRKCGIHLWAHEDSTRLGCQPHARQLQRFLDVEWAAGPVPGSFFVGQVFNQFAEFLDAIAAADPGQLRYFGGKSLVTQSHGESLMTYSRARYRIRGLYLLDEPETALSPRSQLELVRIIHAMAGAGHAQFLICSHSPILLACPGALLYSFDASPVRRIAYEETEHYRVFRDFMADPRACLGSA